MRNLVDRTLDRLAGWCWLGSGHEDRRNEAAPMLEELVTAHQIVGMSPRDGILPEGVWEAVPTTWVEWPMPDLCPGGMYGWLMVRHEDGSMTSHPVWSVDDMVGIPDTVVVARPSPAGPFETDCLGTVSRVSKAKLLECWRTAYSIAVAYHADVFNEAV